MQVHDFDFLITVAFLEVGQCAMFCRRLNALCKLSLPIAFRAILGGESNIYFSLLSLPRIVPKVRGGALSWLIEATAKLSMLTSSGDFHLKIKRQPNLDMLPLFLFGAVFPHFSFPRVKHGFMSHCINISHGSLLNHGLNRFANYGYEESWFVLTMQTRSVHM